MLPFLLSIITILNKGSRVAVIVLTNGCHHLINVVTVFINADLLPL